MGDEPYFLTITILYCLIFSYLSLFILFLGFIHLHHDRVLGISNLLQLIFETVGIILSPPVDPRQTRVLAVLVLVLVSLCHFLICGSNT